ncbi:monovalent cation/H(+) antiporter subunit G [Pseudogemmobacter bohemicus]|uniref:monovalent cation/H(+) antiporter subunit G n=1 Tax=Pseudogemmobacter bohemicus TaxID=2250708 RepID=UPI000DD3331D|nr:monovalent cation/H(+) antiporter subunit G [Pseudogemmobacter bohemicus]
MTEVITGLLALAAGIFAVIAAIGVLRFPDVLTRMHAASKVGSFAGGLALLAAAVGFATTGAVVKAVFAILFLFLTAPIAAHLIGRASAWRNGAMRRGRR